MLSDHDRKALRDVERQCMAEDPAFARSFRERQARLSRRPRKIGGAVAIAVAALLATSMLIAGSPAAALAFGVTTWLVWMAWRRSTDGNRRTP